MIARIKKNDLVQVLVGKDAGKQGVVIAIAPKKGQVMVKGVEIVTRHAKPRRAGDVAGIKKEERFFSWNKVMPVCSACKKPCRVNAKTAADGRLVRACNRCEEAF